MTLPTSEEESTCLIFLKYIDIEERNVFAKNFYQDKVLLQLDRIIL